MNCRNYFDIIKSLTQFGIHDTALQHRIVDKKFPTGFIHYSCNCNNGFVTISKLFFVCSGNLTQAFSASWHAHRKHFFSAISGLYIIQYNHLQNKYTYKQFSFFCPSFYFFIDEMPSLVVTGIYSFNKNKYKMLLLHN